MILMRNEIIELFKEEGLSKIGFVKLEYFKELEETYYLQYKYEYKTEFQVGNVDDKTFKNNTLFNSAIVVLMPYKRYSSNVKIDCAYVASSFCGIDYHIILKDKLKLISDFLLKLGFKAKICVDNNELDERYLAYKAGLGFYGLNHLLINEEYGTYFFIGVILTDAVFEYDEVKGEECLKCGKCIKNCPGEAIKGNGMFDGKSCVSYINQKKNMTSREERFINQCIFGCDICAEVCPHNDKVTICEDERVLIDVKNYKHMSNRNFNNKYKNYAFSWCGRNVFERNINIYKQKLEK